MKSDEFSLPLPNPIIHNKSIFPSNVFASPNAENSIHFFINKSDPKHHKKTEEIFMRTTHTKKISKIKEHVFKSQDSSFHKNRIHFFFFRERNIKLNIYHSPLYRGKNSYQQPCAIPFSESRMFRISNRQRDSV